MVLLRIADLVSFWHLLWKVSLILCPFLIFADDFKNYFLVCNITQLIVSFSMLLQYGGGCPLTFLEESLRCERNCKIRQIIYWFIYPVTIFFLTFWITYVIHQNTQ